MPLASMNLQQCIDQEIDSMSSLIDVLKKEQLMLADGQISSMVELTEVKANLLRTANELENIRIGLLRANGFTADSTGIQKWLAGFNEDDEIPSRWKKLIMLTSVANDVNKLNGGLIHKQLAVTQTALNILQQNNNDTGLYAANGQSALNKIQSKGYVLG